MTRRIILVDIGAGLTLRGVLPSVALFADYSAQLKARGGQAPYTYTVTAGTAELTAAGLQLDPATGILSGTASVPGTIAITVRATDLSGAYVERGFVVAVIAEPLSLSGAAPDGTVGVTQTYAYAIAGGIPPYIVTLIDEPPGWSVPDPMSPTISITAQDSGIKTWTVRATDSVGTSFDLVDEMFVEAATADPIAVSIYEKIVGWWERDEVSGTTMIDAHTHGLDGIYTGVTLDQTPLAPNLGRSVTFPGGNVSAKVNGNAMLDIQGDLSVLCWVKRVGAQQQYPKIMWKPYASPGQGYANYLLQQDNAAGAGKVLFRVTPAAGSVNYDALSTSALGDGVVTMLGGRRAGTEVAIFVNGSKQGTATLPASTVLGTSNGLALNWGYNGDSRDPFAGGQDQSIVFEPALTDAEFAYLYNSGDGISYAALKAAAGH